MNPQPMFNPLDAVDARTRLAGSNAMELLLFSLGTPETFGINVFKVREITRTPPITRAPNLPAGVEGLVSLRGSIIPVVSLSEILGLDESGCSRSTMMVTEFSQHVQGFLLHRVDSIVRVDWGDVRPADALTGGTKSYVTAVVSITGGKLVSVLDVEHVLGCIYGDAQVPDIEPVAKSDVITVFFTDDSSIARREIGRVLDKLQVQKQHAANGREAWARLQSMAARAQAEGEPLSRRLSLVLVDAEMPEMDGYVLTRCIKSDARFAGIPVVMHSSLSSDANRAMGASVGVDAYVPKFDAKLLAETLRPLILRAASPAVIPEVQT